MPFWADVETWSPSCAVLYRHAVTRDLTRATKIVRQNFRSTKTFTATWVMAATWLSVTFANGGVARNYEPASTHCNFSLLLSKAILYLKETDFFTHRVLRGRMDI